MDPAIDPTVHPATRERARLAVVAALFLAIGLGMGLGASQIATPDAAMPAEADFDVVATAWQLLHEKYVDPAALDPTAMAHAAIRAMTEVVGDTDHTVFLDPAEAASAGAEREAAGGYLRPDVRLVDSAPVPGADLAFIEVLGISDGAADMLRTAIAEATRAGDEGIVLDLRGNGGGSIDEAVEIVGLFVSDGVAYLQRARGEDPVSVPVATAPPPSDLPLVVLVDADTASAAELIAGALQANGRATLVGMPTAGLGTILSGYELADGSELWIGESEWRLPDGRVVWRRGIEPDVRVLLEGEARPLWAADLVAMSQADLAASADAQLLRAIAIARVPLPPESDAADDAPVTVAFCLFFFLGSVIAWQVVIEYRAEGPRYR